MSMAMEWIKNHIKFFITPKYEPILCLCKRMGVSPTQPTNPHASSRLDLDQPRVFNLQPRTDSQ